MESEYKIPVLPPLPASLDSKTFSNSSCPPCQFPTSSSMTMSTQNNQLKTFEMMMWEKKYNSINSGNSTFFLMIVSAIFFGIGIWLSSTLKGYAPGGPNEDAKSFTIMQVLSTLLISAGVLVLVIAWFTGK